MKPFILCMDEYDAVDQIETMIQYYKRLEAVCPLENSNDELFLWKYVYINWKGLQDIDPLYWDMENTEKYEFFITIHLCKSYNNILDYSMEEYNKGNLTNILGYPKSAIVYLLRNKDYMKQLYKICPIDHNHPANLDKDLFDHLREVGLNPVYA